MEEEVERSPQTRATLSEAALSGHDRITAWAAVVVCTKAGQSGHQLSIATQLGEGTYKEGPSIQARMLTDFCLLFLTRHDLSPR